MAENQQNYIVVCKIFIIFGVANSTSFRTLQTNNNDAYETISNSPNTALSLLLLTACKTKTADGQKDSGVAVGHFPDQREYLKEFKDDIVIMKCEDYDFNTAPIGIGNKFFTLLHGWVYTDGVLSHTITGQGLTLGILVQDFPNYEDLKEYGGYYVSDKPYIKMNLYRTKDAVWFMNKRYPIARENADSIFSP